MTGVIGGMSLHRTKYYLWTLEIGFSLPISFARPAPGRDRHQDTKGLLEKT
jgi:hypothetical protein